MAKEKSQVVWVFNIFRDCIFNSYQSFNKSPFLNIYQSYKMYLFLIT